MSATPEQIADAEERAKALLPAIMTLMEYGIPADVQELLVRGSPHLGVRAGALQAAITSAQSERVRVLEEALKPFADAIEWEEAEGNFGVLFMEGAPAQRFRDEVELRFVAWWGKDEELESADTFCTLGDLRRAARVLKGAA